MSDKLKSMSIEDLVCEAYEIGHAHGMNAFRMARDEPVQRVDEGWGPIFEEIERRFKELETKLMHLQED